jgi:hypothetical protein
MARHARAVSTKWKIDVPRVELRSDNDDSKQCAEICVVSIGAQHGQWSKVSYISRLRPILGKW